MMGILPQLHLGFGEQTSQVHPFLDSAGRSGATMWKKWSRAINHGSSSYHLTSMGKEQELKPRPAGQVIRGMDITWTVFTNFTRGECR